MATTVSVAVKEELLHTRFFSLPESHENTEDHAAETTTVANGSICIKTEPYNAAVLEDDEGNDDPTTHDDGGDENSGEAVDRSVACNLKVLQGTFDTQNTSCSASTARLMDGAAVSLTQNIVLVTVNGTVAGPEAGLSPSVAAQDRIQEIHFPGLYPQPANEEVQGLESETGEPSHPQERELAAVAVPRAQATHGQHGLLQCEPRISAYNRPPQFEPIHKPEKPYKCEQCGVGFNHVKSMRRHLKLHTGVKPHECEVCHMTFAQRGTLKRHMDRHSGQKPYKCELCQVVFTQYRNLQRHLLKHDNQERHFECKLCPSTFRDASGLSYHVQAQHGGEKRFKCDLCPSAFITRVSLRRHVDTHAGRKPYKCDTCPAAFNDSSNLKRHLLVHNGQKPYGCQQCPATFNHPSSLMRHVRRHTGNRPYACALCPATFIQSSQLRSHRQNHIMANVQ